MDDDTSKTCQELAFIILALLAACAGCTLRPRLLPPLPAEILSVEGYGSASVRGREAALKGRFSFFFANNGRGRVDAFDPLGRTQSFILLDQNKAYLVIPSRKAYWAGTPEEVMGMFLGFSLSPGEAVSLLCGRWEGLEENPDTQDSGRRWKVERDVDGRVLGASRGDLRLEIGASFERSPVPRTVAFSGSGSSGRLKILDIHFNPPPREDALAPVFLRAFEAKTRADMERMLWGED